MRTTITLDDAVIDDLMRLTKARSRTEAIDRALGEWIRRKKMDELKALRGKLSTDGDLGDLRRLEIEEAKSFDG